MHAAKVAVHAQPGKGSSYIFYSLLLIYMHAAKVAVRAQPPLLPPTQQTQTGQQRCDLVKARIQSGSCPGLADAVYQPLGIWGKLNCPAPPPNASINYEGHAVSTLCSMLPLNVRNSSTDPIPASTESCMLVWNHTYRDSSYCKDYDQYFPRAPTWRSWDNNRMFRPKDFMPSSYIAVGIQGETFPDFSDYVVPLQLIPDTVAVNMIPTPPVEMQLSHVVAVAMGRVPDRELLVDIRLDFLPLYTSATGCGRSMNKSELIPGVFYFDARAMVWRSVREHVGMSQFPQSRHDQYNGSSIRVLLQPRQVASLLPPPKRKDTHIVVFLVAMPSPPGSIRQRNEDDWYDSWNLAPTTVPAAYPYSSTLQNYMDSVDRMTMTTIGKKPPPMCRQPVAKDARQMLLASRMKKIVMGSPFMLLLPLMPMHNATIRLVLPVGSVSALDDEAASTVLGGGNSSRRRNLLQVYYTGEQQQQQPSFFNNQSDEWQSIAKNCTYNATIQAYECALGASFFEANGLEVMFANLLDNVTTTTPEPASQQSPATTTTRPATTPDTTPEPASQQSLATTTARPATTPVTTPEPTSQQQQAMPQWAYFVVGGAVFLFVAMLVVLCVWSRCRKNRSKKARAVYHVVSPTDNGDGVKPRSSMMGLFQLSSAKDFFRDSRLELNAPQRCC